MSCRDDFLQMLYDPISDISVNGNMMSTSASLSKLVSSSIQTQDQSYGKVLISNFSIVASEMNART